MIFEDIQKVYELAIAYIGNGRYFAFAMASMLFLYVTSKKIRPRLIYPTLLVLVIIGTPWLYHYVFNRDAYWRTFWMFPGAVLIALFCVRLIQACESKGERIGMTFFLVFLLFFMGTNMYSAERTRYDGSKERILSETTNPEKITSGTKQVADILLAIEDSPKVVSRKKYVYELRQYSAKIKLYYGRDIDGFIIPVTDKNGWRARIHKMLESSSPRYSSILKACDKAGYNFLITSANYRISESLLDENGYREVAIVDGSAIYYKEHPVGSTDTETEGDPEADAANTSEETTEAEVAAEAATEETGQDIQAAEETVQDIQAVEEAVQDTQTAEEVEQNTQTAEETGNEEGQEQATADQETDGAELLEQFASDS